MLSARAGVTDAGSGKAEPVLPVDASRALVEWYARHRRDLPWRRTRDPYAIWVSEIMLQQTRVAAVLEHYARWMERFPAVAALAAADEAAVLALWSGLGYYRRARMLHRAARMVMDECGGVLPESVEGLKALPGIGEYTSAAIASIAFGERVPVVDGNVERVVSRVLALEPVGSVTASVTGAGGFSVKETISVTEKSGMVTAVSLAKAIRAGAAALIAGGEPGDANQAMMELGATVCLPRGPLCLACPLRPWCRTRGEHAVAVRAKPTVRYAAYALVERGRGGAREVLLRQRGADESLMAGMWELPELAAKPEDAEVVMELRHSITVWSYRVKIVRGVAGDFRVSAKSGLGWCAVSELSEIALTGLTRKVLKRLG